MNRSLILAILASGAGISGAILGTGDGGVMLFFGGVLGLWAIRETFRSKE